MFINFRNRPLVMIDDPYPHFIPLRKEVFDRLVYPVLGNVSTSRVRDTFNVIANRAPDLTDRDHLIAFGMPATQQNYSEAAISTVWDTRELSIRTDLKVEDCVWRSPYAKIPAPIGNLHYERLPFIMSLAGNDEGLYDDIMQSIAPLVMEKKPDGVIWWVGDGANGKSTLMDALYRIFPGQLASITVKRLVDGRDTPSLNGQLANIVKESSEGRVDDTEIYKAIGTHENFRVHKFHSQDDIEVRGNLHHIFSANQVPAFNDKGHSARRRTFIIPFGQRFESDPEFEQKTFTPEFFGDLIKEMCRYAIILQKQGYKYKWSAATLAAKADYDADANNAEEYAKQLIDEGVLAFDTFQPLLIDYENWCNENGMVPLGRGNVKKAMLALGFEQIQWRAPGAKMPRRIWRLKGATSDLVAFGMGRPGLMTTPGFQKIEPQEAQVPADFPEPTPEEPVEEAPKPDEKVSILMNKW